MSDVKDRIKAKIEELRSWLQADGGDLELIEVDEGSKKVKVRLHGACVGCPMSENTLKGFVLVNLKDVWPELKDVISVK